jgi:crossover junction endodeoxyribonuclease RusA
MTITLPLPYRPLSPNVTCHPLTKSKYVKQYRTIARLRMLEALGGKPSPGFKEYRLRFFFGTNRKRDDDNAAASFKAGRDGIADALRMDDHGLRMASSPQMFTDKENPRLEVTLS